MTPGATTDKKRILVTGGAGYVGSHTVYELLVAGHYVCVIDNLVNAVQDAAASKPESLLRVQSLCSKTCDFVNVDLLNPTQLQGVFKSHGPFDVVIHFASLKAVGESCQQPLRYYKNNGLGTINLLETMIQFGVKRFVFSSSATVYGTPAYLPIDEKHVVGLNLTNPYGKTKYFIEQILADVVAADPEWKVCVLRYFNPVGAHPSGLIGEDPLGQPNNLMPFIAQVAIGRRPFLNVYGSDYDTVDGTGVRDYIHVTDLSVGHLAAMTKLFKPAFAGWRAYNLGTGVGYSVLQVVAAFEQASGVKIKHKVVERRAGDIGTSYADCGLAEHELGWRAEKTLLEMCADSWRWQSKNPTGFSKPGV